MRKVRGRKLSRRNFVKLTGAAAATAAGLGPLFLFPDRARASQKTLKIAKWAHFLPDYDLWFEGALAQEWGRQHDTKVVVDHIRVERIHAVAAAEVKAGKGHDVFMFPWPPAEFQKHVIDHAEIYQTVAFKFGNLDQLAHRSTYDPRAKRYFAFADSWIPAPLREPAQRRQADPGGVRRPLRPGAGAEPGEQHHASHSALCVPQPCCRF